MNWADAGGARLPPGDDAVRAESRALRAALARFATRAEWMASAGGPALAARLAAHLAPVRLFVPSDAGARADGTLHVVHWNVLHGVAFDGVRGALRREPALAGADLVSLNEVDVGMRRSGGRDVAFDLAAALGLHAAWAAQFLELQGGARAGEPPVEDPGPAWFGLALLSRHPLAEVRRIELPAPHDLLFDRERKAGGFVALVARVAHPERPFACAVTHLDVHGSPQARAVQMQRVLAAIPDGPAIVCGDFNTTTFARGGAARSAATLAMLAGLPRSRSRRRLLAPDLPAATPREPLFAVLARAGFAVTPFNDRSETLDVRFSDVHELDALPRVARRAALQLLRFVERKSVMRLDWIAARGFAAADPPATLPHLMRGATPASDHAPIACRVRFA